MNNRFVLNLNPSALPDDQTGAVAMQELIRLVDQLNTAMPPIVVGPNQSLPTGIAVGQPVIDWSSGTSTIKVWDGENLV
jgi:hypothetical protein